MNAVLSNAKSWEWAVARRLTLAQVRARKFMSALDLAEKSGVAFTTIVGIEQKDRKPRLETIEKLAVALDLDPTSIEWPGNPFSLPPQFDIKSAPPTVQTAEAGLIIALTNERLRDEVRYAEHRLRQTMKDVGYQEDTIESAVEDAYARAEEAKAPKD